MNGRTEQNQGNLGVVRGGKTFIRGRRRGPRMLTQAERELDRRMHTQFARITDADGHVPDRPHYNIRECTQFPWRPWARLIIGVMRNPSMGVQGRAASLCTIREFYDWADEVLSASTGSDLPRAA